MNTGYQQLLEERQGRLEADRQLAQRDYVSARLANDVGAEVEIQGRMSRIERDQQRLEEEWAAAEQRAHQVQRQPTVEDYITHLRSRGEISDTEAQYAREHPELMTNATARQRCLVYSHDAGQAGLKRGTPEFFEYLDERLGYNGNGGGSRQTETLTAEEAKIADETCGREAYARQKAKLRELKRQGHYGY